MTPRLSPRQLQCLRLMRDGLSVKQIAERLGISPYTVSDHLKAAYRRLGASNGTHAVTIASGLGYLDPETLR